MSVNSAKGFVSGEMIQALVDKNRSEPYKQGVNVSFNEFQNLVDGVFDDQGNAPPDQPNTANLLSVKLGMEDHAKDLRKMVSELSKDGRFTDRELYNSFNILKGDRSKEINRHDVSHVNGSGNDGGNDGGGSGGSKPKGISIKKATQLDFTGFDNRPTNGSAKHTAALGDLNGDGHTEYFVTTKKGGTSTLFFSDRKGAYTPHDQWYMPSYSAKTIDTNGDGKADYLIKTSKIRAEDVGKKPNKDYVDWLDGSKAHTTILKITNNPDNPLKPVMYLDRSVPTVIADINGDGYDDMLVTHHTNESEYVARYYIGKDDSDGKPFESDHRWASTGAGTSMDTKNGEHKARWGDLQYIDNKTIRFYAVGAEDIDNHVVYWEYNRKTDTFDVNPKKLDVSEIDKAKERARNNFNISTDYGLIYNVPT